MFTTLKQGLQKTRNYFINGLNNLFKKDISPNLLEDLETILLQADLGVTTCDQIILKITKKLNRHQLTDPAVIYKTLLTVLLEILQPCEKPLIIPDNIKPFVVLLVGVNGAGKTTTIGKLASYYKSINKTNISINETKRSINETNISIDETNISINEKESSINKTNICINEKESNINKTNISINETNISINETNI